MHSPRKLMRWLRYHWFDILAVTVASMLGWIIAQCVDDYREDTWPAPNEVRVWGVGD